jgi:Ca-activated chloride channel homolog
MKIKTLLLVLSGLLMNVTLFGSSLRITQIDSSTLLLNQNVVLYLGLMDSQGGSISNLNQSNFEIYESANGNNYQQIKQIENFQTNSNVNNGINFLLLIDNSGSMYQTMDGRKAVDKKQRRISIARSAVKSFMDSIASSKDRVGLAAYNTYYESISKLTSDKAAIEAYLDNIRMPKNKNEFFSEIYGSLLLATDAFKSIKGRKVIIILSDGENASLFEKTGQVHRVFKDRIIKYQEPLEKLQKQGISLYVINFGKKGDKKDKHLIKIADQSGGSTFDSHNPNDLKKVYFSIVKQIVKEYQLTYKASMEPSEKKFVKVVYKGKKERLSSERFYFTGTVFGQPVKELKTEIFAAFAIAVMLLVLLSQVRFEKQLKQPSLQILNKGSANVSTQILTLGQDRINIGSGGNANITIAGIPSIQDNHATVFYDKTKDLYKLSGNGKLTVNNQVVVTKVLESGDLINIDGVTMVFDEGLKKLK